MSGPYPVYVVDDDPAIRNWIVDACDAQGRLCATFEDGQAFLHVVEKLAPGCVLLDMRMPRVSGLQVQSELVARSRPMIVIAMTGYGGVDVAVQSMRMGAIDFLEKPFTLDDLYDAFAAADEKLKMVSG